MTNLTLTALPRKSEVQSQGPPRSDPVTTPGVNPGTGTDTNERSSGRQEPSAEIDVLFVGHTGVGKSSLVNTIMGVPDQSKAAARVSDDARPCTTHTTSYTFSLQTGLRCNLWDTRGIDEALGAQRLMANLVDRIRQLATQQARELKETLRNRTRLAIPILVWCIDAMKIDLEVYWQQFRKVYVEYCERKAIPVVVITRGPPKKTEWELKCREELKWLDLGVDVPILMVRKYHNPSSLEHVEDSRALRDLISKLATKSLFP